MLRLCLKKTKSKKRKGNVYTTYLFIYVIVEYILYLHSCQGSDEAASEKIF